MSRSDFAKNIVENEPRTGCPLPHPTTFSRPEFQFKTFARFQYILYSEYDQLRIDIKIISNETQKTVDKVLVASGSLKASSLTCSLKALGHTITPLAPSLFAFNSYYALASCLHVHSFRSIDDLVVV